ncbi:MAG: nuclease [Actinobacteria bacterium]|nr:nuclease [Actinomycetota bacterium]
MKMRRLLIECNDEKGSFRRYRAVKAHGGNATVTLVPDALASRLPGAVRVLQAAALVVIPVIFAGCAAAAPPLDLTPARTDLVPKGDAVAGAIVERVVDGDTIHVRINGDDVTVRMIGIDTPETVKPGSPVECFGPESSDFAKEALTGQSVTLELDVSQGDEDRYGRLLAYVWREAPDGSLTLFNLDAVAGGYARERQYGSVPYAWKAELAQAGLAAEAAGAGLWGAC